MGGSIFLILIATVLTTFANAAPSCRELFSITYGDFKNSFSFSEHYQLDLSEGHVKNQCASPNCHLYVWTTELESFHDIPLSSRYLDAMRVYDMATMALDLGKADINLGSFAYESRKAIRKYGLVPQGAWQGKKDFIKRDNYPRLEQSVETIITRALWDLKRKRNAQVIKGIKESAKKEIYELLDNMIGPFPTEFEYKGLRYTPQSFSRTFFPELYSMMTDVQLINGYGKTDRKIYKDHTDVIMSFTKGEKLLRKILDAGQPVFLTFFYKEQFVDEKTGIMSVNAFEFPESATVLSIDQMNKYEQWGDGHAALIVGYEVDPATNRVSKWKLQNSWGSHHGDKGFYHMYRDYFETFVWGFSYVE